MSNAVRTRSPRVAVVSHACVVDVNQEPFLALAQRGVPVHVFAPERLRTDIRGTIAFSALDGVEATPLRTAIGGFRRGLRQAGVHLIVYRKLGSALQRMRPDLLYVEEEPWSLTALQVCRLAARLRVPFAFHQSQNLAKRLPPPFSSIRRRVLARAAGATARLGRPAQILRAQGFAGELLEIPNVIDPSRFDVAPVFTALERPVFGFAGRLVPEKGVIDFLNAAATARASLGRGSAIVAGDGPLAAEARSLAARLGLPVTFTGAVAHGDMGAVYASMDVLTMPSRSTGTWTEQFGRVVIEANAACVPVVVTECGELGATVRATGGGISVPERDPAALADALASLAGDEALRASLGEAGRRVVRERFTPEAVAAQLDDFFCRLEARR